MKYIQLDAGKVCGIIPAEDPIFPGIPIDQRFSPDFISALVPVDDGETVESGWIYEDGAFHEPPPPPEIDEVTGEEVPEAEPSTADDLMNMAVDLDYRLTLLELGVE